MKEITLENDNYVAKINTLGAEIHHLIRKSDGAELVWCGDKEVWKFHAPVLFPFIGRIYNDHYMIDGQRCVFERNHGFARDMEAKVTVEEPDHAVLEITSNEESLALYPYKFSFVTEYQLTDKGLNWKITVKNLDNKAFKFQLGTHTAFTCPKNTDSAGTSISDYEVVFSSGSPLTSVLCSDRGYVMGDGSHIAPYGEKVPGVVPLSAAGFGLGHLFKNDSDWVGLRNKKDGSIVSISTKGFPYCMLWQNQVGEPQFVCIEPWFGTPDTETATSDWNQKFEMQILEPGQSFTSVQNIVER